MLKAFLIVVGIILLASMIVVVYAFLKVFRILDDE